MQHRNAVLFDFNIVCDSVTAGPEFTTILSLETTKIWYISKGYLQKTSYRRGLLVVFKYTDGLQRWKQIVYKLANTDRKIQNGYKFKNRAVHANQTAPSHQAK